MRFVLRISLSLSLSLSLSHSLSLSVNTNGVTLIFHDSDLEKRKLSSMFPRETIHEMMRAASDSRKQLMWVNGDLRASDFQLTLLSLSCCVSSLGGGFLLSSPPGVIPPALQPPGAAGILPQWDRFEHTYE